MSQYFPWDVLNEPKNGSIFNIPVMFLFFHSAWLKPFHNLLTGEVLGMGVEHPHPVLWSLVSQLISPRYNNRMETLESPKWAWLSFQRVTPCFVAAAKAPNTVFSLFSPYSSVSSPRLSPASTLQCSVVLGGSKPLSCIKNALRRHLGVFWGCASIHKGFSDISMSQRGSNLSPSPPEGTQVYSTLFQLFFLFGVPLKDSELANCLWQAMLNATSGHG